MGGATVDKQSKHSFAPHAQESLVVEQLIVSERVSWTTSKKREHLNCIIKAKWAFQVMLVVKNPPANAEEVRATVSIPGSGRSPGGGHGNLLQDFCLENPRDRRSWLTTVHRFAKDIVRQRKKREEWKVEKTESKGVVLQMN